MGRRSGFVGLLNAMARESARQQRLAEAAQRRAVREQVAAERAAERAIRQYEKEERLHYLEDRQIEAEEATSDIAEQVAELCGVLEATLSLDDAIDFESLRLHDRYPAFSPPAALAHAPLPPREDDYVNRVSQPSGLSRLIPGSRAKYEAACVAARAQCRLDLQKYEQREAERVRALAEARGDYEAQKATHDAEVAKRNSEVDELEAAYNAGAPDAITAYASMVLERSEYPDGSPQEFQLAYVAESKELVVQYELPGPDIVPAVAEVRYVRARDHLEEKPRKATECKALYQDVVAAVALRTIHELLESDRPGFIQVVTFNGFVQGIDRSTGKDVRPCLISVRTTRERFDGIDLARVDKRVCLRGLGAQVSPSAYEIQPVKPIVEFDMLDRRFVAQSEVLAELDARPNLMDLNPFEFENLVGNLFSQMGLETKLTRSSRDGGVDVVAFDTRPILGGKVVIQAKRYRHTVTVSAVRDLYGTMQHEGANKGILVTTSGFGPDAFDFAKDKPIELLDGGKLLYLLEQVGVKARIIFPEETVGA